MDIIFYYVLNVCLLTIRVDTYLDNRDRYNNNMTEWRRRIRDASSVIREKLENQFIFYLKLENLRFSIKYLVRVFIVMIIK